jgi:TolB-like protein
MGTLSGDPDQEYFVDGTTDELITDLGRNACLRAEIFLSGVRIRVSVRQAQC